MIGTAAMLAMLLLGLALLGTLVRVVRGPTLADRILGLDTMMLVLVGVIAVYAVQVRISAYIDIALALTLLSFMSTIAFARYLLSRRPS